MDTLGDFLSIPMPDIVMAGVGASAFVKSKISSRPVILFSKSYCPESKKIKQLLKNEYSLDGTQYEAIDIERRQDVSQIEDYFMIVCLSERRELPQLWVGGKYIGNEFHIRRLHDSGDLSTILQSAGITKKHGDSPAATENATCSASKQKQKS